MTPPPLTSELITGDTRRWRLSLQVCHDALEAVLRPIGDTDSQGLLWSRISFTTDISESQALQEAVYANPLLVAPFGRVDVLVRSPRFLLAPAADAAEVATEVAALFGWDDADEETLISEADGTYAVVSRADTATVNFLRRTFGGVELRHPLAVLARWFGRRSLLGNSGKIYVNIGTGRYDLLTFNSLGLATATSLPAASPTDMCYYILAAGQTAGLRPDDCEIHLAGDPALRTALTAELRRFAPIVVPAIFPSALLAYGQKALGAPLELSILPLCE